MNSFLALRDQELTQFTGERRQKVRHRVERNLHTAEFIASVVELFGPVLADTMNVLGGGHSMLEGEKLRILSETEDDDPYGPGPGVGEIVR